MAKSPFSILIVDDNLDEGFLAKRAILKSGVNCIAEVASDGFQAKERLSNANTFALILLDFNLSGIHGLEILKFIRNHEKTRYVPVVMLSSSRLEADVKASYDAGANSFLRKTLDLTEFIEELTAVIHYWTVINVLPVKASESGNY